jgi:hypothetical protein
VLDLFARGRDSSGFIAEDFCKFSREDSLSRWLHGEATVALCRLVISAEQVLDRDSLNNQNSHKDGTAHVFCLHINYRPLYK